MGRMRTRRSRRRTPKSSDLAMIEFLEAALKQMHVEAERRQFLLEFWNRRQEFWSWQEQALGSRFRSDCMPVFLHGGDTAGKILIMGINPGFQGKLDELIEKTVQNDAGAYVSLHEDFFRDYPSYIQRAGPGRGSPFWNNLRSKLRAMLPDELIPDDKWQAYRRLVVAQDILPFRSTSQSTSAEDIRSDKILSRVTTAALEGLQLTDARMVWLFSQEGYQAIDVASGSLPFISNRRRFSVSGCTRTGTHRTVDAILVTLERQGGRQPLPLLAVRNAILTQPLFPFEISYCSRATCSPRLSMADQLRRQMGRP